ncbi:MAG: hypothetical protein V7L04_29795 [Nostoc sp.]|uniref:hypothetical protein n=1 Tax=unclassified Nostoc TaxID=2593658 RepID=UPI002609A457|nr:hypothetical protein [Nostoc sp. S13]MDF5740356.1 hypothetical protein [Nostoc sp. S13]
MGAFLAVAFNFDKIVGSDFGEPSSSIKATIEKPPVRFTQSISTPISFPIASLIEDEKASDY